MPKKATQNNEEKALLIHSPIFFEGLLVYEQSGHPLTQVNGYYICSKKQKGQCKYESDVNLSVKRLDLQMLKLLKRWEIDNDFFVEKIRKPMSTVIEKLKAEADTTNNKIIEDGLRSVILIKQDYNRCKKINQNDLKNIKDCYATLLRINYPRCLLVFALMGIFHLVLENKAGILPLFKKVYINEKGEVHRIELEGIGEFALNVVENVIPEFSEWLGVEIIRPLDIKTANPIEVLEYFKKDNFTKSLDYSIFRSQHSFDKHIEELFKSTKGGRGWEITNFAEYLLTIMWKDMDVYFHPGRKFITKNNFPKVNFDKHPHITLVNLNKLVRKLS